MLAPVADALDIAVSHALVHRNLNGHSLLLADGDRLLLDTFGLLTDEDAPARTVAGASDLRYRSPEQAAGEPLGRPANIYSLAALVVHALRGAAPYEDERLTVLYSAEAEEPSHGRVVARRIAYAITGGWRFGAGPEAILDQRLTLVPLRVSERMPQLGREIDAVVARGMAADPAKRQASATELMRDVAGALGVAWPDPAAPVPARPRLQLVTERMHPVPPVPAPATGGGRRWLAAAGVAAALALRSGRRPRGGAVRSRRLRPGRAATAVAWSALDDQRAGMREQLAPARRRTRRRRPRPRALGDLYGNAARTGRPRALAARGRRGEGGV